MATSRTRASRHSDLGDSWVVNNSDSEHSSIDKDSSPPSENLAPRPTNSSHSRSGNSQPAQRRRSSRASSAGPEPELVMPYIRKGEVASSWTRAKGESNSAVPPRKRASKASSASYTSMSRAGRRVSETGGSQRSYNSEGDDKQDAVHTVLSLLGHSTHWVLDVLGGAFKALRKPISLVVALYLFAGLLVLLQNILTRSVYSALSPICRIPGMSALGLPICRKPFPPGYEHAPDGPVEFEKLMNVQGQFEEVLEACAAGVSLPIDMKRSESSIRNLRQIVRFSRLNSKHELILELDGFIEAARTATWDLQKFNSGVGRGVDIVLVTARWTQRVLDDIAVKNSNRGLLPAFVHDKLLAPFQPLTENTVVNQYIEHTRVLSKEIERLIAEAQALLYLLKSLEDRLEVIHGIALGDNIRVQGQKDEILSQLWTLLGGNRVALRKFDSELELLHQVNEFRKIAWAHVSGTIIRLQAMGAELGELKGRVESAEVLKDTTEIPLAMHLESIRLGVERLQEGRKTSRELEQGYLNKVLNRGGKDNEILLVEG